MSSALSFLATARRCEIAELDQLALTCELVGVTGRLVHALQRERGLSSLYLGFHGAHFARPRLDQIDECAPLERALRDWFDSLGAGPTPLGGRARLYNRLAYAQQGLDALPALRDRITMLDCSAQRSSAAFKRLIAALLTVVFEAADGATDPEVSRLLVAIFHLMQGKEFAGQERAIGAAMLATGLVDGDEQKRLLRLIESDERCAAIVDAFSTVPGADAMAAASVAAGSDAMAAGADARSAGSDARSAAASATAATRGATTTAPVPTSTSGTPAGLGADADLERLRRVLLTCAAGTPLPPNQESVWFAACSARIDAMKLAEDALVARLLDLCRRKIAEARAELPRYEALAAAAAAAVPGAAATAGATAATAPGARTAANAPTASTASTATTASTASTATSAATAATQPTVTTRTTLTPEPTPATPAPGDSSGAALPFFDLPIAGALPGHDPLWGDGDDRLQPLGHGLGRSVLELVCEQSGRLQTMKTELDAVRATLNERKVIERAKGLLMAHRKLSEDQAHRALRQLAMSQSRRLVDVAEAVLTASDVIAAESRPAP